MLIRHEVIGDERVPRVRFNMLVRPLSRTDKVIGDEHVPRFLFLQSFLTDDPYRRSKTYAFSIHHQIIYIKLDLQEKKKPIRLQTKKKKKKNTPP